MFYPPNFREPHPTEIGQAAISEAQAPLSGLAHYYKADNAMTLIMLMRLARESSHGKYNSTILRIMNEEM